MEVNLCTIEVVLCCGSFSKVWRFSGTVDVVSTVELNFCTVEVVQYSGQIKTRHRGLLRMF